MNTSLRQSLVVDLTKQALPALSDEIQEPGKTENQRGILELIKATSELPSVTHGVCSDSGKRASVSDCP